MPASFGTRLTVVSVNVEDKSVILTDEHGIEYAVDIQRGDEPKWSDDEPEEDTDTDTVTDAQLEELIAAEEVSTEQPAQLATFQQLPSMVREALTKLVNYDYEEEKENYEQETKDTCEEGEVLADHIFYDLDLLKDWIGEGEQPADPEEYEREAAAVYLESLTPEELRTKFPQVFKVD